MTNKTVRWVYFDMIIDSWTHEVLVVEYNDNNELNYWVKCGGLIDATVRNNYGRGIVGIGAKKYEEIIRDCIWKFKTEILKKEQEKYNHGLRLVKKEKN